MNIKPDKSLISQANIGIALEMGRDGDQMTLTKTIKGVECLLAHFGLIRQKNSYGYKTKYFEVFSQIFKPAGAILESHIRNFNLIHVGETFARISKVEEVKAEFDFYPVIFGNSNYETIFGFAARDLTSNL